MAKQQDALSVASTVSRSLYHELIAAVRAIGRFNEEVKKTSIHLVRGSAFIGIHPRKEYLLLTVKAEKPNRSARVLRAEQVSKNRWHLDVKVGAAKDIDAELMGWIRAAYQLSD